MKLPILATSVSAFLTIVLGSSARAAVVDFNGSGTDWSLAADWTNLTTGLNGLPQASDDLLINSASLAAGSTDALNAALTVQTLSFDIGTNSITINANASGTTGQTLTLNGTSGTDALGNQTTLIDLSSATTGTVNIGVASGFGTTTVALGTSGIINVSNASAVLNFGANSVISGGGSSIFFTGAGTLTLAGTNTFGGAGSFFAMSSGTVNINNASALGDSGNLFTIGGGTIDNTSGAAVTMSNYAQHWNANFTFNGSNALNMGAGAVTLGASPTITVKGSGANGTLTVGGAISDGGAGYGLTKAGNGTLILSGANSYAGPTTLEGGTLQLNGNSSADATGYTLGDASSGPSNLVLKLGSGFSANNVTLPVVGNATRAINVTVSGQGSGTNTIDVSSAGTNPDLTLVLNGPAILKGPKSQLFSSISGPGAGAGNTSLTVDVNGGNFVWTSNGTANTFLGNVHIINSSATGGSLQMQNNSYVANDASHQNLMIPDTASVTLDSNITWKITHGVETIDGLNGAGNITNVSGTNYLAGVATLTVGASNGGGLFSGGLSDGGTAFSLAKTGTGTQELSGSSITYSGSTTLSNGTLKLTKTTGFASNVSLDNANTVDLQLNAPLAADSWTFSKAINGGSANATIEKIGQGTVTLNPASGSTFVGSATNAITVTGGTLNLAGTFATAPAVSVASGATFGGATTVGAVTVANNGGLLAGTGGSGQTVASALTFSGLGTVNIGSITNYASATALNISGADGLVLNGSSGSVTINIASIPGGTTGIFKLISYSGAIGGADFGGFHLAPLPSRAVGSLVNNAGEVDLNITGTDFLKWTGAGTLANGWDTSTSNWVLNSSGSSTTYIDNPGDTVVFDDTASPANATVNVASTVHPSNVTFNNNTDSYVLQGTGGIAGVTGITINGPGAVTLSTTNSYTGSTRINGGSLSIGSTANLPSASALTFAGGALKLTAGMTLSNNVTIASGQTGSMKVTGSFTITLTGSYSGDAGTLTLDASAASSFNGFAINSANGPALGSVVNFVGTLNGNNALLGLGNSTGQAFFANSKLSITATGSGTTFLQGGNGTTTNLQFGALDGGNATTVLGFDNRTGTVTINGVADGNFGGKIFNGNGSAGALTLIKNGTAVQTLSGTNTYTGPTTINAGTLLVSGSISGSAATVNSGGTLAGSGTTGGVTVKSGGTILPGTLGVLGNLKTGALTFNGGGTFSLQINTGSVNGSGVVASSVDTISGGLTLGTTSPILSLSDLGSGMTLAIGDTIPFATYTGTWDGNLFSVGGTPIANGGSFSFGSNTYQLNYNGGTSGNTVLLTVVVPEPSTYVALLGGIGMLTGLRRFRRRD